MAVYNTRAEYLSMAVTSILNQTYHNLEFIIIDDCSQKKETIEYLESLKDERIVLLKNDVNLGLTKSLNKGLNIAHGSYVARMDADDIASPERILKQYEYAQKHNCMFLGADFNIIPGKHFKPYFDYDYDKYKIRMIFDTVGPMHSSFFFNKEYFNKNGIRYDEKYRSAQDYALLCDLISIGCKIGFCKQKLLSWRINDDQVSIIHKEEQWKNACDIRKNYIKRNYNISEENLEYIVNVLNRQFNTRKIIDTRKAESVLKDFINENTDEKLIKEEIYRYWFVEALRRIKRIKKIDIVFTKMFWECFKPWYLSYIFKDIVISRCGYVL